MKAYYHAHELAYVASGDSGSLRDTQEVVRIKSDGFESEEK